jgi:calcineurin-like phosphoesterase family protein
LHLDHANVINLDGRPFRTMEEMNDYIVKQWNSVTKQDDTVYILGDLSFSKGERTNELLKKLNGKKYLILGNHDNRFVKDYHFDKSLIKEIKSYDEVIDGGRRVIVSHYPHIFYNGQYRVDENGNPKTYMLFGHIHNTQDQDLLNKLLKIAKEYRYEDKRTGQKKSIPFNLINCFCLFSDFKPLTLNEWIKLNEKREREINNAR